MIFIYIFFINLINCQSIALNDHDSNKINIPIGGNSFVNTVDSIKDEGLIAWQDPKTICRTYIRLNQVGTLKCSFLINTHSNNSKLKITMLGKSFLIDVKTSNDKEYFAGEWKVSQPGYLTIELQGLEKSGDSFGHLSMLYLSGSAINNDVSYVKNNDDNYFYWGRRGPSVHLKYSVDESKEIEWFYSELTVSKNNDVIGSFFMANGFKEGYFGMQVNSETERRILFSIWSPFQTDDPQAIPESDKIKLLKKGQATHVGEFGDEGSGGQSYLVFNWQVALTYKFLLRAQKQADNSTIFTAYFFAPELKKWLLVAKFKRPKTTNYLKNLHSFLENFIPESGDQTRSAFYGNQWIRDIKGNWIALTKATFTADATAKINYRKDYSGGTNEDQFFLRNAGFFNDFTELNKIFNRQQLLEKPLIDFNLLESL